MIYTAHYNSPFGDILLAEKDNKLIGAWLENQKYYLSGLKEEMQENEKCEILIKTKKWLDRYFNNEKPNIKELELNPIGSEFRKNVWKKLCNIPYGKVVTYKYVAKEIAREMGLDTMSAQAVGGAISHNPILIIIPCHRVIGSDGSLTGYAGGVDIKKALLEHENVDMSNLFISENIDNM